MIGTYIYQKNDFRNADCKNIGGSEECSSGVKKLGQTYSEFSDTTMSGWNFLYNNVTGNTGMSKEQLNNLDKLHDIKLAAKNWSGYGSDKICIDVIEVCEVIVRNICFQPVLFPTGRNSIQMQYELADRSYLEIEIFEEKIVCMEVPQRVYERAEFEVLSDLDMKRINQIVKEFYGE